MSYDLMVFDVSKAPKTRKEFMRWYQKQTQWEEDHNYASIKVTSPELRQWFMEMIKTFPPMNGEYAASLEQSEEMEANITDYCIGREVIYMAFAWSVSEQACRMTRELAQRCNVGFFDVSGSEGDVIFPDGSFL